MAFISLLSACSSLLAKVSEPMSIHDENKEPSCLDEDEESSSSDEEDDIKDSPAI